MTFSERYGYREAPAEDLIREDAPEGVRVGFLAIFEKALRPSKLRDVVCKVLRKRPDPNNWTEHPNMWNEVQELVHDASWYRFYDIVEAAIAAVQNDATLVGELNALFAEESLAWHVVRGRVTLRTSDVSDEIIRRAGDGLAAADRPAAQQELRGAVEALSRRPQPDTRDAVRHALGAMEAVARDITGERSLTLGAILKRRGNLLPPPLDAAFEKIWGYGSEVARHVDETKEPTIEEAVLVVGLIAAALAYLARHRDD